MYFSMQPTVITSWTLLLAKALDARGIESREFFRAAGLDPALLTRAGARYPALKMPGLWQRAVELTGEECIGLESAKYWHPTTAHALGYTWLASDNLGEAFTRLQRYIHIFNDATVVTINDDSGQYMVAIAGNYGDIRAADEGIDAGVATLVQMCRAAAGADFSPLRVELRREPPGCAEKFYEFFRCPVQFNGEVDAIYLDLPSIQRQLPESNRELALANELVTIDYLSRLQSSDTTLKAVKVMVDKLPDGSVTAEQIARELHLSPRTFQRRLQQEDTSFSQLLDAVRRELATTYMEATDKSVTEITYLLGFAETSTFSRAFKRWTGQSPTTFRNAS